MQQFHKFITLTFMCGSTCFGRLPAHHQEHTTALETSGFTVGEKRLERCCSRSDGTRPTTFQPLFSNGKTGGSYCSCMILIMSGETPETCWATHKRQVINFWNCCILLVELFESMIMHGLANVKYLTKPGTHYPHVTWADIKLTFYFQLLPCPFPCVGSHMLISIIWWLGVI
jgi:hypothetical protein